VASSYPFPRNDGCYPRYGRRYVYSASSRPNPASTTCAELVSLLFPGAVRHLHSLRLMKRDGGFIHQLLQEAENERMHLLTFLSLVKNPSVPFRALVLVSQGVFVRLACSSPRERTGTDRRIDSCGAVQPLLSLLSLRSEDGPSLRRVSRGGSRSDLVSVISRLFTLERHQLIWYPALLPSQHSSD
jgi:hypothetical protein